MTSFELELKEKAPLLYGSFIESKKEVEHLLQKYAANFPQYTDHSINHTFEVFKIASEILTPEEIKNLNTDEIYILSMACILHDVGMCIPEEKVESLLKTNELKIYKEAHPNLSDEEAIRDLHHNLSRKFINEEFDLLKIPSKKYADAIGIVAEGHRKTDLGDFDLYNPHYFAKNGRESVCLPYLACVLRVADELDVTNSRVPKLLMKYYMPKNEISIIEWQKHISTSQRNYLDHKVIFEVGCSDQNIYAALQDQFDKIQNVINYCQKVIRAIPFIEGKHYLLNLSLVDVKYNFVGFDPKGIRFSFDVQNVVTAFIGEDLYKDKLTSLREAVQNAVDSCRYKSKVLKENYTPSITAEVNDEYVRIEDNGAGMDEFIIENFFGRLGSSFYEQEKIKTQFEAIGQFGVGVFSYFLISEYIDIETKTANNAALKFRFDKDPKSYFHFYDSCERTTPGTTITMFLKQSLIGKLTSNILMQYIGEKFRHIEIPIEIKDKSGDAVLKPRGFSLDKDKEIKERLRLVNRNLSSRYDIKTAYINTDEIEGVCGLIIAKDIKKIFSDGSLYFDFDQFSTVYRNSYSEIGFSQKGVYVNDYSSYGTDLLIGEINIKKKIKINIDRNEFADKRRILSYVAPFELKILKEIVDSEDFRELADLDKFKVSKDYINGYLRFVSFRFGSNELNLEYIKFLNEFVLLKVFVDDAFKYISVENLLKRYNEFILISEKENSKEVFGCFKMPVVVADGHLYEGSFEPVSALFSDLNKCVMCVDMCNGKGYLRVQIKSSSAGFHENKDKLNYLHHDRLVGVVESSSHALLVSVWRNKKEFEKDRNLKTDVSFINCNHWFSQFLLSGYNEIIKRQEFEKIVNSALEYLQALQDNRRRSLSQIKKVNDMLKPLNSIGELNEITLEDFE